MYPLCAWKHTLTSQCWYSYASLVNGKEANIPSSPTVLNMPVNTKSRGNYGLQSRESKTSFCPFLPSCLVHLQHLACSHLETNTPNLPLTLCEVCRALTCETMAWAVCGLSLFKLFSFQQQLSVVWVNLVCLHTESWTAHHVLWFFSKGLAPHRPRRKTHEYHALHLVQHVGAHFTVKKERWQAQVSMLRSSLCGFTLHWVQWEFWMNDEGSGTIPLPCAHDLACPFYLLSDPSSDHLCFCSSTLQPWK